MGRDVAAVPDVALEQTSEAQKLGKLLAELVVLACSTHTRLQVRPRSRFQRALILCACARSRCGDHGEGLLLLFVSRIHRGERLAPHQRLRSRGPGNGPGTGVQVRSNFHHTASLARELERPAWGPAQVTSGKALPHKRRIWWLLELAVCQRQQTAVNFQRETGPCIRANRDLDFWRRSLRSRALNWHPNPSNMRLMAPCNTFDSRLRQEQAPRFHFAS